MASSIGAARQALWTLLSNAAGLSDVQVTFGRPERPEGKGVALLGVSDPGENFVLLGPLSATEEAYGIELLVWWYDPEAPPERTAGVDEIAFGIADVVRDVVRANLSLTRTVRTARVASQRSEGVRKPEGSDTNKAPTGRVCIIEMTIACVARAA